MVKALMPAPGFLNSAGSGLPWFVLEVSQQVVGDGVCINNLVPKIHNFNRIKGFNKTMVRKLNISIEQVLKKTIARNYTGHYENLIGFGNMCFLWRQYASFIVG
jgi:3-oxoacyl-[acyl-carrier protein] reductase